MEPNEEQFKQAAREHLERLVAYKDELKREINNKKYHFNKAVQDIAQIKALVHNKGQAAKKRSKKRQEEQQEEQQEEYQ